jgi:ABC-type Na+ efflux pump permease subunit
MAKTSTSSLSVAVSGDGIVGETYVPQGYPVVNVAAPAGGEFPYALTSGDNTIAVPAGAIGYILRPLTSSIVAKQIRSASSVVGPSIAPALPFGPLFFPASPPANIVVNAASPEPVFVMWL